MTQKIPWIGTGWKMNKLRADAVGFANTLKGISHCQHRVGPDLRPSAISLYRRGGRIS